MIGATEINSLPLVTRNFTQIASLSPGVTANVYNASALGRGGIDWAVNGQDPTSNNVLMEGSSINNMTTGQNSNPEAFYGDIATPSPDAIQEFKVQTSLFDAAYGRQAGGSVNVILKSGTNDLHGSLFEFLRNDDLNANDFFANRAGLPRGDLKQNQFGGTVGGPLKKDKLFWFLSYQGTRQVNGVAAQGFQTVQVPTQLTNDRSAATLGSEFCPGNNPVGRPGATFAYTFDPTPGAINPATDQVACSGANINPVALRILNAKLPNGQFVIPSPTAILNAGTASAVGVASLTSPATYNEDQAVGKIDDAVSAKETLSGRYFYSYGPENRPFNCSPCTLGSGVNTYSGPVCGVQVDYFALTDPGERSALLLLLHSRRSEHHRSAHPRRSGHPELRTKQLDPQRTRHSHGWTVHSRGNQRGWGLTRRRMNGPTSFPGPTAATPSEQDTINYSTPGR